MNSSQVEIQNSCQSKSLGNRRLEGKVALVTGGSRGIGAAITQRLAADGAQVLFSYVSSEDAAQELLKKLVSSGCDARSFKADVRSESEARDLVAAVKESFAKVDILINNAGVYDARPLTDLDLDHFDRVFAVNVKGVVATTVAALKLMPDGGRIINISSGAAKFAMPGASIYSASKAALDTFSRIWAQELGLRKITVNSVSPGTTQTEMFKQAISADAHAMVVSKTALGRIGEPADIADVVAFLASDDGRWITGQVIGVDGGLII